MRLTLIKYKTEISMKEIPQIGHITINFYIQRTDQYPKVLFK